MIALRPATLDELPALSALCLRSKAFRGYDAAFMAACEAELTLTAADLTTGKLLVADEGGTALGIVQVAVAGDTARIRHLFVAPEAIGRGVGRRLFTAACGIAVQADAARVTLDADPGARVFYERMGARLVGEVPSGSIPGRMLPLMQIDLEPMREVLP